MLPDVLVLCASSDLLERALHADKCFVPTRQHAHASNPRISTGFALCRPFVVCIHPIRSVFYRTWAKDRVPSDDEDSEGDHNNMSCSIGDGVAGTAWSMFAMMMPQG